MLVCTTSHCGPPHIVKEERRTQDQARMGSLSISHRRFPHVMEDQHLSGCDQLGGMLLLRTLFFALFMKKKKKFGNSRERCFLESRRAEGLGGRSDFLASM